MATNFKRMDEIRKIIKTYLDCSSFKTTSKLMNVSRNTIKRYVKKCNEAGVELRSIEALDDQFLKNLFYNKAISDSFDRASHFESQVTYFFAELRKKGVSRYLLWKEYLDLNPEGYRYSQFCDRLLRHAKKKNLTLALNHPPGKKLMVDFTGGKMIWYDPESGQQNRAEVLVGVLPHSQYTFAIALPSQKIEDFIHGLNEMLAYIGGCPEVLLSDNLRSYVTRADRYEPVFTDLCVQLAAHYGLHLEATRVAKPKDKASVENMVSTVYTRLFAPLRNRVFHSIDQINEAFKEQLSIHNNMEFQKKPGSRYSVFKEFEEGLLTSLPSEPFEIKRITRAKIQPNYHAFLGEDKNYYSVPYKYVGAKVVIIYTRKLVEIYHKEERIAVHQRLVDNQTYQYISQQNHKPKAHQIYEDLKNINSRDLLEEASLAGPNTKWGIEYVLTSPPNKEQSYRSCLGILRLNKSYGYDRLESACKLCRKVAHVNYHMLLNILRRNLDLEEQVPLVEKPTVEHNNIRGAASYF